MKFLAPFLLFLFLAANVMGQSKNIKSKTSMDIELIKSRQNRIAALPDSLDYILNLDSAAAAQVASIHISGSAIIDSGLRYKNTEMRMFGDSGETRSPNINLGIRYNTLKGKYMNMIIGGSKDYPNRILGGNSLQFIMGYDNLIDSAIASYIFGQHSIISHPANHAIILGGATDTISYGAKVGMISCQFTRIGGSFSGAYNTISSTVLGDYSQAYGGSGIKINASYVSSLGGKNKSYTSSYGGGIGGQTIDFDNAFSTNYSINLAGLNMSAGTLRSTQYSGAGGRDMLLNGDYSWALGRADTVNGSNAYALGYKAYVNHSGSYVFNDGSGVQLKSTATNQFSAKFSNGYKLTGGALTIANLTTPGLMKNSAAGLVSTATAGVDYVIPSAVEKQLKDFYTDAGNASTSETDLYTYITPANRLATNGEKLIAKYAGKFVSSATATRQVKAYFGNTQIFDTGALNISANSSWTINVIVIRVSATAIRYSVTLETQNAPSAVYPATGELTGLNLAGTNAIKITGQAGGTGAATNDVLAQLGNIKWEPAAQ